MAQEGFEMGEGKEGRFGVDLKRLGVGLWLHSGPSERLFNQLPLLVLPQPHPLRQPHKLPQPLPHILNTNPSPILRVQPRPQIQPLPDLFLIGLKRKSISDLTHGLLIVGQFLLGKLVLDLWAHFEDCFDD